MILTQSFRATQPKDLLDSLNRESGRVYSQMVVTHWRIYRKKGIWLSPSAATRLNDYQTGATTLHAHSRDAAQQGFFKACKTTRSLRWAGFGGTRFPYKRKFFRTTIWKNTGLEVREGILWLKRARGLERVRVELPVHLHQVTIVEARLVYNRQAKAYDWHIVCEDGLEPPLAPGQRLVAVDMGEIHPAAASSDSEAVVFSARELRSTIQGRNKSLAEISALQNRCQRGSRRWKKLQQAKNRIRGKAKRKQRDICHKVSHEIVQFAKEQQAKKIIIGDVRDVADGVTTGKKNNQKSASGPMECCVAISPTKVSVRGLIRLCKMKPTAAKPAPAVVIATNRGDGSISVPSAVSAAAAMVRSVHPIS